MKLVHPSNGNSKKHFSTDAIHFGYNPADNNGAINPPVYMSSTFAFDTAEQGGQIFAGEEQGYVYSRIANPTVALLEERIAHLEGGESGLATASGMGAICSVLWSLVSVGEEIIADKTLYGCTYSYFRTLETRFGIKVNFVDLNDLDAFEAAITKRTKLVYFETPANPNLRLVDIETVSNIAHENGLTVVADNTFATPYLQNPLKLGADVVVHSATKYLGGHGDLVAGIVVSTTELIEKFRLEGVKDMTGAVLSPMDANLILRGLKTLHLRMDRHCATALLIAEYLEQNPLVKNVYYPGLESNEHHMLAKTQMRDFGGLVAFELVGGLEAGRKFVNALSLITIAVSLGDAETLVQHPASMTHSPYEPEVREAAGISDGLVRMSAGLEAADDIIADLEGAFRSLQSGDMEKIA